MGEPLMPVAGIPEAMQGNVVTRAWLLYSMHKKSLRECAAILYPDTQYASEASLMQAIYRQFKHLELPMRGSHPVKGKQQRPKRRSLA
jgi:hypothetical protein